MMLRAIRSLDRFLRRREDGSVTVEAAIWIPGMLLLMVMAIDTAWVFTHRAQALRIIQDGNRGLAVFQLADEAAATDYVLTRIRNFAPSATGSTITDPVQKVIITQVDIPLSELDIVGFFSLFRSHQVSVIAHQLREEWR